MKTQHLVPRPDRLTVEHVSVRGFLHPLTDFVRPRGATPLYPPLALVEPDMGVDAAEDAAQAAHDDAVWLAQWKFHLGHGDSVA